MPYSYVNYPANGSTQNFTFSFSYLDPSHIHVYVEGVETTSFTFLNSNTIRFATAPTSGSTIEIRRITPKDVPVVDFQDGSVILERDLDLLATFNLYVSQETDDLAANGFFVGEDGTFTADNRRISGLATPVNPEDAANKAYIDTGVASQIAIANNINSQSQALLAQAQQVIGSFTISTSDPSGGSEGDVWFKVTN